MSLPVALPSLRSGPDARTWMSPALLLAALAVIVAGRWAATVAGLDALAVGVGYGLALAAMWWLAWAAGDAAPRRGRIAAGMVLGGAAGLALVAIAAGGPVLAGVTLPPGLGRPAAPFVPWVAVTIVVAVAQEGLLRGVLLDRLRAAAGLAAAVAITTLAFALIHVPLYGWHVVPLDLAVGLALAGLRVSTGTVAAPAAAHAVADLATWWL